MTKQEINKKVADGSIYWSCFECADKYRTNKPYDGTVTVHEGICDICKQAKPITSASKLFGQHKFL